MLTPFEFSIYTGCICGLLMVGGAIWLLRTRVIKLSQAGKDPNGLNLEVAHKIKISTSYPAIALFVIGLCFIALAMFVSKPESALPLNIVGKLNIDDASKVTVKIEPDNVIDFQPDTDGKLDQVFNVDFKRVKVEINAAGYSPQTTLLTLRVENAHGHQINLPSDIIFTKLGEEKPATGTILPIPANLSPPLHGLSQF